MLSFAIPVVVDQVGGVMESVHQNIPLQHCGGAIHNPRSKFSRAAVVSLPARLAFSSEVVRP